MKGLFKMKVAIYARYSTDKQTENSIAYQVDTMKKFCAENGHEIVAEFADEAKSGTNIDRGDFQRMLEGARLRLYEGIVIYEVKRGSRDVGDWFSFRKEMALLGIQVISVKNNLGDITNANDFIVELMSVGVGHMEVLSTRQMTIDGIAAKAKQGQFLGGVPPLGYRIENGKYVINPTEAKAVQLIFEMYASGCGYSKIIDALAGMPGRYGRPVGKNSLYTILRNERYIGVYTWNKRIMKIMRKWAGGKPNPNAVRIEGIIPRIIEDDLWERVQGRVKNSTRGQNKAKRQYLLSGIIECASCGAKYVGHTSTNSRGYQSRYYTCGNKYRTRTCKAKNINADKLEEFVIMNLKAFFRDADFSDVAHEVAQQVNGASPDLTAEKCELAEISKQISNGLKAVLAGMDVPELKTEIDKLRTRKSELEDILSAAEVTGGAKINEDAIIAILRHAADTIDADPRNAIINCATKIYADIDGSCSVNIGVHIGGCGDRI
ncbi:recombinase family protein [Christensenella hongkongensis]|uniref:recombinase family protein n=1 Tax=Christensenella hongkongensis TaxID=270498 RepID=UPI0009EA426A|nr:recombinase family protein [Christensenella hongkongensis]